jgi:hypothetical protein
MRAAEEHDAYYEAQMNIVERLLSATLKIPTATVILSLHFAADVENGRISAITLSSGSLAEIQRSASIDGAETWRIEVPLEQIDDILKSLLVRDTTGKVQSVTLDGPSPVEETFRRLPFTPQQLGSLPELASSLQGVRVKPTSGQRTIQEAILGAQENVVKADGEQRKENILSVMTADGQINVLRLGPEYGFRRP